MYTVYRMYVVFLFASCNGLCTNQLETSLQLRDTGAGLSQCIIYITLWSTRHSWMLGDWRLWLPRPAPQRVVLIFVVWLFVHPFGTMTHNERTNLILTLLIKSYAFVICFLFFLSLHSRFKTLLFVSGGYCGCPTPTWSYYPVRRHLENQLILRIIFTFVFRKCSCVI